MKDFEREKLLEIFEDLLLIHSPSYGEEKVAEYIINFVEEPVSYTHLTLPTILLV